MCPSKYKTDILLLFYSQHLLSSYPFDPILPCLTILSIYSWLAVTAFSLPCGVHFLTCTFCVRMWHEPACSKQGSQPIDQLESTNLRLKYIRTPYLFIHLLTQVIVEQTVRSIVIFSHCKALEKKNQRWEKECKAPLLHGCFLFLFTCL